MRQPCLRRILLVAALAVVSLSVTGTGGTEQEPFEPFGHTVAAEAIGAASHQEAWPLVEADVDVCQKQDGALQLRLAGRVPKYRGGRNYFYTAHSCGAPDTHTCLAVFSRPPRGRPKVSKILLSIGRSRAHEFVGDDGRLRLLAEDGSLLQLPIASSCEP